MNLPNGSKVGMSVGEKLVVALSGGKDSTAMAVRLMEVEPADYEFVCTPTGDEPPEMFAHWSDMEIAIGLVLFWLTLAVWFAIQAVFDARSEARRQRFLDKWEE